MIHITSKENRERREKARKYLRLFIMDTPELNRLIRGYESSNEQLDLALDLTIDDWNTTPPPIAAVDYNTFPSLWILLHGATIQLLKMQGLFQTRNFLPYSSAGSSFTRFDKGPQYAQWLSMFNAEYQSRKQNLKIARNIQGAYGGVHSEYYSLGWW